MSGADVIEVVGIKPWKRWQIDPFLRSEGTRLHYAASATAALANQARHGGQIAIWAAREPVDFAQRAAAQAASVIRIEDGFLRSVGLGSNHVGAASLVIDQNGIYFDPRSPSTLETTLEAGIDDPGLLARAARVRAALVRSGVTKYNTGQRQIAPLDCPRGRRIILVPGQVEDDASLRLGAREPRTNLELLARVRAEEPSAWIVFKPHPDTDALTRKGRVTDEEALRHADRVIRDVAVTALFPHVHVVHTMTSLVGFEALIHGVPVITWGLPFYAGWGLTEDRHPVVRRQHRPSLDELVAVALIVYPRYIDPDTGQPCEVERIIDLLSEAQPSGFRKDRSLTRRYGRLLRGLYRSWRSERG